jgi:hypothetical protein
MRLALTNDNKTLEPVSDMEHDQNWRWPEKTWFRERLNAVKAREHEQRRKSTEDSDKADEISEPSSPEQKKLKVD